MIHQSVSEPLKKFSTIFPAYHQQLKQREKSLNEYGKIHSKLQKYEITNDIILDQLEYDYRAFRESEQSVVGPVP